MVAASEGPVHNRHLGADEADGDGRHLQQHAPHGAEAGTLLFLRNWPYVYSLASTDASSVVKDTFGVAALPGITGIGTSSPGGHSAGMSVYSQHKGTALDLMKFLESEEIQRFYVTQASNAPVTAKLYDDPDLKQC